MTVPLEEIVEYLREFLSIDEIPDDPNAVNGLQVEAQGPVNRIVSAVDASLATIERISSAGSGESGATLLLVHHGLLWGGNRPITGSRYRRLALLIQSNTALYSAHLPLDLHSEVGNNAVLARRLDVRRQGTFGDYKGVPLGVWGTVEATSRLAFASRLARTVGIDPAEVKVIPGGPEEVRRVGIISGAGGSLVAAARNAGLDTLVTGEGPHHAYFDAMEGGINLIYGGHYATETAGVQVLGAHLGKSFDLPFEFHDHPTGL